MGMGNQAITVDVVDEEIIALYSKVHLDKLYEILGTLDIDIIDFAKDSDYSDSGVNFDATTKIYKEDSEVSLFNQRYTKKLHRR